jgi:hypothetical protein
MTSHSQYPLFLTLPSYTFNSKNSTIFAACASVYFYQRVGALVIPKGIATYMCFPHITALVLQSLTTGQLISPHKRFLGGSVISTYLVTSSISINGPLIASVQVYGQLLSCIIKNHHVLVRLENNEETTPLHVHVYDACNT